MKCCATRWCLIKERNYYQTHPQQQRMASRRLIAPRGISGVATKTTYATFLLLAVAGFIIAGYVGLALFFVGALR